MRAKWTLGRILVPLVTSAVVSGFLTSVTIAMASRRHDSCPVVPLRDPGRRGDLAA